MATHGLIIVAMKADNELSISVLLYFKSVKKKKKMFKKKKKKKKRPPPKKKKKKPVRKCFLWRESNPWPLTCKVNTLSIVPNS